MKAAFLRRIGELYVGDLPLPQCVDGSVLVNVREIGICGSDLHYFNEGRIGDHIVTEPHILGHEASGVVAEVGKGVEGFSVGDRVAIEPGIPCMACELCRAGRYNLCPEVHFSGAPPHQGMFREYLLHDPRFLHKLPDSVSFTQGALVEPLAVAHNAIRKAGIVPGDTVLITGAGPIGLSCIEMAIVAGAARIIVSEPKEHRRASASALGADLVLDPEDGSTAASVMDFTAGRMADCAIEASGSERAIDLTIRGIRKGGADRLRGNGQGEPEPAPRRDTSPGSRHIRRLPLCE